MRCKKILPLLLTGTIALSLAACSGGKAAESPAPAPATESRSEETVQSIEETPETNGDRYIGEYTDPDSGSVEMEIAENEDGTYVVQIGIYRLTELSDGVGTLEADGLRFTATDANGNPISGVITPKPPKKPGTEASSGTATARRWTGSGISASTAPSGWRSWRPGSGSAPASKSCG